MHRDFKDHFSGMAAGYADYRPQYPAALGIALARLSPQRDLALDSGCGSGQLSLLLAPHFERVIGTDASAAQIAHAKPGPRVEYRVAPAEESGLGAASADLVVAAQAAHWFDLPAYWREVRRVARPGALVALVGYEPVQLDGPAGEVLRHFHDVTLAGFWPPERQMVIERYGNVALPFAEVDPPELPPLAHSWTLEQLLAYLSTWSAVKELRQAGGAGTLSAFQQRLSEAWGDPQRQRLHRWPLFLRLGRA